MRIHLPLCLCLSAAVCAAMLGNATQAGAASVPTTTALAITSGGSAVTTVSSGTVVTLTATVVAGTTPVTVGLVTFCDASAAHCTDIHIVGTAQLTSAGTATYKFRPGVGSHSYNAVFAGTPHGAPAYAGSTSSAAALAVTGLWPSITTLAVSPGTTSGTFNFTATVGGNGSTAPTGTVSFLDASNGDSVLGSATLGAGAAGTSLFNTSNLEIGRGDPFIVAGDFNSDGIPDLAVTNTYTASVTILLGNGDGTFTATAASPQVESAYAIAAADFNGDGILDLAVTSSPYTNLTILLGNGDGTFTPVSANPAVSGSYPLSLAVGDFNGDGIPDLAVANQCGTPPLSCPLGTVSILLGNGDGTFTPAVSLTTGFNPNFIAVGDFNGDGNLDLAVLNGIVTIWLGDGTGNFTTGAGAAVGSDADALTVGDFNGDGILDLAVANEGSANVTVLLGNGNGTFTSAPTSPVKGGVATSVAVGDFNGDGIPDLATATTILIGDGAGNFAPAASSPYVFTSPLFSGSPYALAVGDFNGDGISDLAVTSDAGFPGLGYSSVAILEAANETAAATANGIAPAAPSDISFEASYPGDSSYSDSASSPTAVLKTPTVTVTPFSSNVVSGQNLPVNVSVSGPPGYPTPTGSVIFLGGGWIGPIALSGGAAQIDDDTTSLAIGSNPLTATYVPDANGSNFYTSAAGASTVYLNPGSVDVPTVKVTPLATSILATQALQVDVAVSGGTGNPTPTGSVTLTGGGYNSGAITLSGGAAAINIPAGALAVGNDGLAVDYTPDASSFDVYASASSTGTVVVTSVTPTVTVTPLATSILTSQALQVNVAVSGGTGNPTPTGSVMLTGGGFNSGAITLTGGAASLTIPAGALAVGSDTLTANYTPDTAGSAYYSSASGSGAVTVAPPNTPTVTVTPLSTSILTDQALQVNVAVGGPSGDPTPTGSVMLTSGNYSSGAVTLTSGTAAIDIPANSLPGGNDTLTASYAPDSASSGTYASATGSASVTVTAPNPLPAVSSMSPAVETAGDSGFTLTINGSDFTSGSVVYWGTSALTTTFVSTAQITASVPASDIASSGTNSVSVQNPSPGGGTSNVLQFEVDSSGAGSPSFTQTTATVTAGQSAIYSVTLPNTASAVTASCLNLPSGASCSYSSSANTVTISTASSTPSGSFQVTVVFAETVAGAASSFIFLPILLTPLLLLRKKSTAGKIWFTACLGLVLLVASVGIGCGGGSSSGPPPPPPTHQVTTSGVVTLKVQ